MAAITNFDTLNALRTEAARTGSGSKGWIGFATVMFDSFPTLYETARRINAEMAELRNIRSREQALSSALRELIATIDLATDCMDGHVDRTMLDLYIENAEALLDDGPVLGADGVLGDFVGQWIDADHALPDSDMTVLICAPDSSEPVWLGFHDGQCWRNVEGFPITVTGWAEMPDLCERKTMQEAA